MSNPRVAFNAAALVTLLHEIKRALAQGLVAPGEAMPSIAQVAADTKVAERTVRRAYAQLVIEGLIEADAGRGYRVVFTDPYHIRNGLVRAMQNGRKPS